MSNGPQFGRLIRDESTERDAVHVAVIPVEANVLLNRGTPVSLVDGRADYNKPGEDPVGVVDPFLGFPVCKGERFWLFLYPGTITGLRHAWTHPAFDEPAELTGRAWIERFCEEHKGDSEYEEPLSADYLIEQGHDRGRDWRGAIGCGNNETMCDALTEHADEFWKNWAIARGVEAPNGSRMPGFRCAC